MESACILPQALDTKASNGQAASETLNGSIEYALIQNVYLCRNCLCDMDNNWVMLLFTSCALLTLSLDLVGGMGHK